MTINLFEHITANAVRAERERTGDGLMTCRDRMQKEALLHHIETAEEIDLRQVLAWLVRRS